MNHGSLLARPPRRVLGALPRLLSVPSPAKAPPPDVEESGARYIVALSVTSSVMVPSLPCPRWYEPSLHSSTTGPRTTGPEALAIGEAAVWPQPDSLILEYGDQTLSASDVELSRGIGKPKTVGVARLFGTSYRRKAGEGSGIGCRTRGKAREGRARDRRGSRRGGSSADDADTVGQSITPNRRSL